MSLLCSRRAAHAIDRMCKLREVLPRRAQLERQACHSSKKKRTVILRDTARLGAPRVGG
jgi:hypothetical protein